MDYFFRTSDYFDEHEVVPRERVPAEVVEWQRATPKAGNSVLFFSDVGIGGIMHGLDPLAFVQIQ